MLESLIVIASGNHVDVGSLCCFVFRRPVARRAQALDAQKLQEDRSSRNYEQTQRQLWQRQELDRGYAELRQRRDLLWRI
jgi:hypothetical protein